MTAPMSLWDKIQNAIAPVPTGMGGLLGEQSWRAPFFGVSVLMTIALVATALFLPSTPPTGRHTSLADPFRALRHKPILLTGLTAVF